MEKLIIEASRRWAEGVYIERGVPLPRTDYPDLPWVQYEEYMRAQIVRAVLGEVGKLIVEFPPERSEDNRLHLHPTSDRIITVVRGSGRFVAKRFGVMMEAALVPSTRVYMPRGTLHTFFAGPEGLLVHSLHLPWIPLDDPQCLVYPEGT